MKLLKFFERWAAAESQVGAPHVLKYDMGSINRMLMRLIIPVVIESALPMLSSIIVVGLIGRTDVLSINSYGIAMLLYTVLWVLFRGFAVGEIVVVSRYWAQKDFKKLGQTVRQAVLFSFLLSVLICASLYVGAEGVLTAFHPSPSLLASSAAYLRIMLPGMPFFAVILMLGGCYQGIGKTMTSMSVIFIMNGISAVFSYLLIFGQYGLPALGLRGAAVAGVISQLIALFISMTILSREKTIARYIYCWDAGGDHWEHVIDICKVGLPASFESLIWQLAIIIITRMLLEYGDNAYAAYQMGNTAESLSYMPATGFVVAATTLISQAAGSNEIGLARIYMKCILKGLVYATLIPVTAFILFPKVLIRMLTDNPDVIQQACTYLVIMGLTEVPLNVTAVLGGGLRALGYPRVPFLIALTGLWLFRVPAILLSTYVFRFPVESIWIIIALDVLLRFGLILGFYRKKKVLHT